MDDASIVRLFLERDEAALEAVQAKYGERLKRLALRIVSDEGTAEECVNDALYEAWNRIPPHKPERYLFAFLAKIVRASALNRADAMGAQKRSAALVELTREMESCLPAPRDTESEFERAELNRALERFVRGLSDEKQAVFLQRYWYLASVKEIAAEYSVTEGKVKSMLFRTRRELAKFLEREGLIR